MFYLLENNRIIDSNNPPTHWKYLKVIIDEDNKHICLCCEKPFGAEFYTILDKKENVFDLINKKEDLVKIDSQIIMAKTINGDLRNLSGISAIYKPDDKGNYIKVWERKEENE